MLNKYVIYTYIYIYIHIYIYIYIYIYYSMIALHGDAVAFQEAARVVVRREGEKPPTILYNIIS